MTFVYLFLPIVCVSYILIRQELRNLMLLAASIIFYAWGEPRYLVIMFLTIIVNYLGAVFIDRYRAKAKWFLFLAIVLNLSFLIYFKYFNFLVENLNNLANSNFDLIKVVMPIGISFYTFQAMSYLVDVYRKEVEVQKDIYKLSLYITLFPALIAGPIVKYHDIKDQIDNRDVNFSKVTYGVKRFIIGLAKKMLIANTLGAVADKIFVLQVGQFDIFTAWLGAICYTMQIYYDFSGYSDMAIGLCLIFGFKIPENFNYPYISKSITEFWRRWHISLSSWFKEYLYIPLGGNRVSKSKNYLNLFIVFLCTGVWHGASWSFVVWGLWHGAFIILEKATNWHKKEGKIISIIQHIYVIFVFTIGWVIFKSDDMSYAWQYIKKMFGFIKSQSPTYKTFYYVDNIEIIALVVAIICAMPIFKNILKIQNKTAHTLVNIWLLILFVISTASIADSTYNPFIYFRF
jgi:alginate O-acetyltransferase complex protein AlgI